jgi:diguanylate cyclase (GGDEF)-like protein
LNKHTEIRSAFTVPQFFHLTGLIIITPFGLWMMLQGQIFWGVLILLASLTSGVSFFLVSSPRLEMLARVIAAVIPGGVVLSFLSYVPQYATLWSFPLVVYFYFQLVLPLAVGLNIIFLILALLVIPDTVTADVLTRFIAAHIIIGTFAGSFSFDRLRKEGELTHMAHYDDLTGLPNRRQILNLIEDWVRRAKRYGDSSVLLFIDVDDFKTINDSRGHSVGDKVLEEIANILSQRIRTTDLIGRLGGEEFVILLDKASVADAQKIAEELLVLCESALFAHGQPLTLSIGAAPFDGNQTVDDWIRDADQAMYQSKRKGGNRLTLTMSQDRIREVWEGDRAENEFR